MYSWCLKSKDLYLLCTWHSTHGGFHTLQDRFYELDACLALFSHQQQQQNEVTANQPMLSSSLAYGFCSLKTNRHCKWDCLESISWMFLPPEAGSFGWWGVVFVAETEPHMKDVNLDGLEQKLTFLTLPETLSTLFVAWWRLLRLYWCLFVCGDARCAFLHGSRSVSAQFA